MKDELKRYYPIKEEPKDGKRRYIKCYLSYSLGGVSWGTGQHEARGYYAHVAPVTTWKCEGVAMESYVGFSGAKWLLVACNRQGPKKEAKAAEMFEAKHKEFVMQLLANSPDKDKVDFDHPEK